MAARKKQKRPTPPPPPVRRSPPRAAATAGPRRRDVERAEAERVRRSAALRRRLVVLGLVAFALATVVAVFLLDRRGDAELRTALTSGTCRVDTEADPTAPAGQNHVPSPSYRVDPPAGGDHEPAAARAGVYDGTAVPTDGLLVHALEHGYVVAWHRPDLAPAQREQLAAFQAQHPEDVIVAERASLPVPVAATAWGQRLLCQQVETGAVERFFDAHVGNGPEDVPRG